MGADVIWSAVIPAKAGIHAANLRKCAVDGLDSRFRGNDRRFERHPIPNDTTTQNVGSGMEMKERDSSKLDERRGDVYENKGSAFHSPRRSGNVYENTGA